MQRIKKQFDRTYLDFNQFTEIFSQDNLISVCSGNWINQYILNGSFQVRDVHKLNYFKNIINKICENENLQGKNLDAHLFLNFIQGANSIIHRDNYDVYLYGLYGETMYIINKEKYILNVGDLLKINNSEIHQEIGLTPRIVLSVADNNKAR